MLIGVLIRGECEIPGRSIYKLEQSILKIFKFSVAGDCGLSSRAGQRTRFCFFGEFFGEKNGTVGGYKTGSVGKL